jgi:hypothetical protein
MTTAATSLLGLALPVTGELSGTWGDTVNNSITSLLDSAIAGTTTLSTDADVTLTTTTLAANTSRQAILLCSGARTALRNITAPAQSKIYTVINATTGGFSVVLRGVGPTTGVTVVAGESAVVAWNGSDFIKVSNTAGAGTFTNLTVTGNTTLGDADTDTITQAASYVTGTQLKSAKTATNTLNLAAYDVDGTAYTNLVTLTASNTPTLALTSTGVGTINNMSVGATTASTGAFTTLSASSTVSGTGFSTYLASPPAIGGTAAAAGSFTTLAASSTLTVTGAGSIQGLTVGKGAGAVASNTAVGASALAANSVGASATAVGYGALQTSTASEVDAFGWYALNSNTTGTLNSAFGNQALRLNTTGLNNIACGTYALRNNTTGSHNTAIGVNAGYGQTTGAYNTFLGEDQGSFNVVTGTSNSGVGYRALLKVSSGSSNTAIGQEALRETTTASNNTAVGYQAGYAVTTGASNTLLGYTAGNNITTGAGNLLLGYGTTTAAAADNFEIVLGFNIVGKGTSTGFINPQGGAVYQGNNSTLWSITSDQRIKENIVTLTTGLSTILALRPVEFDYIETKKHDISFIAQEYQQVLPDQVTEHSASPAEQEIAGTDTLLGLTPNLVPYLVAAIKELNAKVDAQAAEIATLKGTA